MCSLLKLISVRDKESPEIHRYHSRDAIIQRHSSQTDFPAFLSEFQRESEPFQLLVALIIWLFPYQCPEYDRLAMALENFSPRQKEFAIVRSVFLRWWRPYSQACCLRFHMKRASHFPIRSSFSIL